MEITSVFPLFRCSKCDSNKPLNEFPPSKARNKGQWCRSCLREDQRRIKGLSAAEHPVKCGWCGTVFQSSYIKAQFCSRNCKNKAKARATQDAIDAVKPDRRCMWCGKDMPRTMRSDAVFCSADCNSLAHRTMRNWRRRSGLTPIKRQRSEPLPSFIDIAERDAWRCGICRKRVNPVLKIPDPMAGSLDHLLPISRGGGNEPSNLQLSHLRCNCMKRANAANDQLRLI